MKKHFCPAPFTTLILNADGKVGCCREKGSEHSIGNSFEQSIEEIWNGEEIKKWRREFLDGEIVTCAKEQHDMSCNLFKHNLELLPFVEFTEIQTGPIKRLSPDINGRCNLKCPMCIIWKKPNGKYDLLNGFWDALEANVLPYLEIMDPLSGEPFIQKDLYKLIEMTAKVNPNCRWNFTTNGQWEFTDYIKSHLDMVQIDLISVSVDTVNHQTYESIRAGGELQSLKRNIVKLMEYVSEREKLKGERIRLVLNFTIQKDNAYEIEEIFSFCEQTQLPPLFLFLYEPSTLSLEDWSDEQKISYLHFYFNKLNKKQLIVTNRLFMAVVRSLKNELEKKKWYSFYEFVTDGDISKIVKASIDPLDYVLNRS